MQPRLIFGTASLHRLATSRQRHRAIAAAYDAGIGSFDLAPAYGNGIDELEVGIALKGKREHIELNTKYGIPLGTYGGRWRHAFAPRRLLDVLTRQSAMAYRRRDFSPQALEKSLGESLIRLRTDHVDCLFLHEPIAALSSNQLDDIVGCGLTMKARGRIKALGVAGPSSSLAFCPGLDRFDVVQTRCEDLDPASRRAPDKPFVLYGVHAAYRASGEDDFPAFVRRLLASRQGTRVIVTSRHVETIGSFRGIAE